MSKITSAFGVYADNLQAVIDSSMDQFAPLWYPQYFDFAPAQQTLTYTGVLGARQIEAAASVVSRGSATPQRSRAGLSKLSGDIPAIREMIPMTENDYRDFLTMQAMNIPDPIKKKQLLDLLWGDVKRVGDAAHKRLDIFALEAISTGSISLTILNNPDGLILTDVVDLLMPATNRLNAIAPWTDAENAKPLTDIENTVNAAKKRGLRFGKMLMEWSTWQLFRATKEVRETMATVVYGKPTAGNALIATTVEKVNEYLSAQRMPIIEVINEVIGIEVDGLTGTIEPFSEENVSFIPDGKLGIVKNAVAIEEMQPVKQVSYGNYNRALISKWQDNEPYMEYTKVELNAFPVVEAMNYICLLKVR